MLSGTCQVPGCGGQKPVPEKERRETEHSPDAVQSGQNRKTGPRGRQYIKIKKYLETQPSVTPIKPSQAAINPMNLKLLYCNGATALKCP